MTVVTIDGPASAGKSTIAAALAVRLHVPHVDTGAFYRAATLAVLRSGVDRGDAERCVEVVTKIHIERCGGRTWLDGEDVEDEIRGHSVTAAVSAVSAHPGVRAALLNAQRAGVGDRGAVIEGRDAGTVVAPDAGVKIWLTASPETRAARRAEQLGHNGRDAVGAHARDLTRRDTLDATQSKPAPGAITVDTTGRTVDDVVTEIEALTRFAADPPPRPV
ncbi:MAG: (d)CMP kinase [Egibacteraceae bacterium]